MLMKTLSNYDILQIVELDYLTLKSAQINVSIRLMSLIRRVVPSRYALNGMDPGFFQ